MKNVFFVILFLILLFGIVFCQNIDFSGTWLGETEVPESGVDKITIVIEKNDEQYSAVISDSVGMFYETKCEDLEFKDDILKFHLTVDDGYQSMSIYVTLTVDGNTMSGYWETEDGGSASIKMERKK
jgi:hypothetical protein